MEPEKRPIEEGGIDAQPPPYSRQNEMPMPQPIGAHDSPQHVTVVTQTTSKTSYSTMQNSIPIMPMWCAVTLCFVNWMVPGFGTMIAAFTVFCCGVVEGPDPNQSKGSVFCLNIGVGCLQLLTCWVFLVGWVWSIIWGYAFITNSARYDERQRMITMTTVTRSNMATVHVPPPISGTADTSFSTPGQSNQNYKQ